MLHRGKVNTINNNNNNSNNNGSGVGPHHSKKFLRHNNRRDTNGHDECNYGSNKNKTVLIVDDDDDYNDANDKDGSRRRNRYVKRCSFLFIIGFSFMAGILAGLFLINVGKTSKDDVPRRSAAVKTTTLKDDSGKRETMTSWRDKTKRYHANGSHNGRGFPRETEENVHEESDISFKRFHPTYPDFFDEFGTRIVNPEKRRLWVKYHSKMRGGKRSDMFTDPDVNAVGDWQLIDDTNLSSAPKVDYTKVDVTYPKLLYEVPEDLSEYPPLETLGSIMERWPQDNLDNPPLPFRETLLHFNHEDPQEMIAAEKFRDAMLPFKVYNVPDVVKAGELWSNDEYVARGFAEGKQGRMVRKGRGGVAGSCQKSYDNFFAFFTKSHWDYDTMGPPPEYDSNFDYSMWAKHARYADRESIPPNEIHYYYQSGVPREERNIPFEQQSFVSRDLPSLSSKGEGFFMWNPNFNKGIQCRFGERGVTAATHYDSGTNMVAMMVGAKRYVLAPPRECPHLAINNEKTHPTFRHSQLNFALLNKIEVRLHFNAPHTF